MMIRSGAIRADYADREARLFAAFMAASLLLHAAGLSLIDSGSVFSILAAPAGGGKRESFVTLQLAPENREDAPKAPTGPHDGAAPMATMSEPIRPETKPLPENEEQKKEEKKEEAPEQEKKEKAPDRELWFVDTDNLPKADKPQENTNLIGEKDVAARSTSGAPFMDGSGGRKDARITTSTPGTAQRASDAPVMEVVPADALPPARPPSREPAAPAPTLMPSDTMMRQAGQPRLDEPRSAAAPLMPERMRMPAAKSEEIADLGNRLPEPATAGGRMAGAAIPLPPSFAAVAAGRPAAEPLWPERYSAATSRPLPITAPEPAQASARNTIPLHAAFSRQGKAVMKEGQDGAAPGKVDLSAIRKHPYAPYLKHVRDRIIYSWHLRYVYDSRIFVRIPERPIIISFRTYPAGNIGDVRIEDDAGNPILASALARAVREAGPLDEFAKHRINERFLSISFHFYFGP